jgi:hypothetical protein
MNFFRSEEHLRKWEGFQEKKKGGMIPLSELMRLFSGPYFTNRRNPDYFSHMGEYLADLVTKLDTLKGAGSHWRMKWFEKLGVKLGVKMGLI